MRTVAHPPLGDVELPEALHALSDPVRLEIVRCLARDGECACGSFPGGRLEVDPLAPLEGFTASGLDRNASRWHP